MSLLPSFLRNIFASDLSQDALNIQSEEGPGGLRLHTSGLGNFQLPDLEITGIPRNQAHHAPTLLLALARSLQDAKKRNRQVQDGENIGGTWEHPQQKA